jgi:spore coat protein A
MITRRQLLQRGAVGSAGLLLGSRIATATAAVAPTYLQPLTMPAVLDKKAGGLVTLYEREGTQNLFPGLPSPVWGYSTSASGASGMLGPTIEVKSGTPVDVTFENNLPSEYPGWLPLDRNLVHNDASVRTLTHLHGAFVPAESDGNPATSRAVRSDEAQSVRYPNAQPATLLWYHDHPDGATRLGVAAGLAGLYIIRDTYDTGGPGNANHLPSDGYEVPLFIQDRQFDADGRIFYPTMEPGVGSVGDCGNALVPDPYDGGTGPWVGEYFGTDFLVNGRVRPFLSVEPRMYRFRVVNACNGRFLNLKVPVPFKLIGTDGGMLPAPVSLTQLVMNPADRVDLLLDFRGLAGKNVAMLNQALPKPYSSPADLITNIMEFRVAKVASSGPTFADIGTNKGKKLTVLSDLNREFASTQVVGPPVEINLDEWNAEGPNWYLTLTNRQTPIGAQGGFSGGSCFDDPVTEEIAAGEVKEWALFNNTGDTHPIHIHLVQFRIIGRQALVGGKPSGALKPPAPFEVGWKDTVAAHPATVTRFQAKFSLPPGITTKQTYMYHCHILEHEDNDMMRPYTVG